jgi:uncharacterized protein (DUF433 family)
MSILSIRGFHEAVELWESIEEDSAMGKQIEVEWEGCDLVERVAGRCGGRPTIKGTRIEPDVVVVDAEMGATPEETHESFPSVPISTIKGILDFARNHQLVP